jgi:hypothetical protein
METKISTGESWKETFLIIALIGGVAIAIFGYYHMQVAMIWSVFVTVVAAILALHARWQTFFTKRLAWVVGAAALIACLLWQYNRPINPQAETTPVTPVPNSASFTEKPTGMVLITVGSNTVMAEAKKLETAPAVFPFPPSFPDFNPFQIYTKNGKPFIDVKVWGGPDNPAAITITGNVFSVTPLNWDSNSNDTAFEAVNERGEPVLQLYYKTPTHLVLNGVFPTPQGVCVAAEIRTVCNPLKPLPLKPLFKYPSYQHRGEFADTAPNTAPNTTSPSPTSTK